MKEFEAENKLMQEAVKCQRSGNNKRASELYRALLKANPDNPDAMHFLGIIEGQAGNYKESIRLISASIGLMSRKYTSNPNHANALNNLGNALRNNGDYEEALDVYNQALRLHPDNSMVLNNIGNVLNDMGQSNKALDCYNQVLRLNPEYADAWVNQGNALRSIVDIDKAIKSYETAIRLNPAHAGAHTNLALALLAGGDFERGWREYEWRWKGNNWDLRPYRLPVWQGESLENKNILVYAEQGIGDEIMFASCVLDIIGSSKNVVLECSTRLEPLFKRSFTAAVCQGVDRKECNITWLNSMPSIDIQIAAGSLPLYLRNTLSDFLQTDSYLRPNPGAFDKWMRRYAELGYGLKVGISWRGGIKKSDKNARSIDLLQWGDIFRISGVNFVNLQYGDCEQEIHRVKDLFGVTLHNWSDSDPLKDMDDYSGQIKALDLVISVDNSTVHLAGSMGVETWVLQPYSGDWRWLRGHRDSYWYPCIHQYWQSAPGEWAAVIADVSDALIERTSNLSR